MNLHKYITYICATAPLNVLVFGHGCTTCAPLELYDGHSFRDIEKTRV